MRKSIKNKLIFIMIVLAALFVFAGCSFEPTLQQFLDQNNLVSSITYYSNGGYFKDNSVKKTLYYHEGDFGFNISESDESIKEGSIITISRDDHVFAEWYHVEMENGQVVYEDEAKEIVKLTDRKVDFTQPLTDDDEWVIGAKWMKNEMLDIILVYDGGSIEVNGATVQSGELLCEYSYYAAQSIAYPDAPVLTDEATFIEYYEDEACTQLVSWPVFRNGTGVNKTLYAKYLQGEWNVLKKSSDLSNKLFSAVNASRNYILVNDINAGGLRVTPFTSFNGKFIGNGKTISNIVAATAVNVTERGFSLFGQIKGNAVIQDVTFKDVQITYTVRSGMNAYLYFFASAVSATAQLNNVKIDGGSMMVDLKGTGDVYNLLDGSKNFVKTHYVFGDWDDNDQDAVTYLTYGSDEEFLTAQTGVTFVLDGENQPKVPTLSAPKLENNS